MTGNGLVLGFAERTEWTFINGEWVDGPAHSLEVPEGLLRQDGEGIQGHHYAFFRPRAYGDMHLRFEFMLNLHSDVGIILRARDPSHFHLLHFPNCGQASRAQHFWAALSRMDDSGYLRIGEMEMLPRVPSTDGIWLDADVRLVGNGLSAKVGDFGLFEADAPHLPEHGRTGVYIFGQAGIRNLAILEGDAFLQAWDEHPSPPRNWFNPLPDTEYGLWQRPGQLVRTPSGDLLFHYNVQEHAYRGKVTPLTSRSTDDGKSWSRPVPLEGLKRGDWEGWGPIHIFPDGVLRMMISDENSFRLSEAIDDGQGWLPPEPVMTSPPPPGLARLHLGPQGFLNLDDGSVVMFGYGAHDSTISESSIYTWGSHHCQAFACRSTNNGRTWTDWVSIDGARDSQGKSVLGSLDLTEVCGAQTGDGRILALIRPIYSPWMWETWSKDGARSWTPCVRGPFPGYATPNMLRTESGAILVAHRLPGCTIHTSFDDGRTWDAGTLIDSAIWVMGSMIEVEPDLVLYIYWDSFESLMRAQFIRLTPEGLEPSRRWEI